MKQKRRYYRTAALLGPQDAHVYPQGRRSIRAEPRPLQIPWRLLVPTLILIGFGAWMALGDVWYLMWDDLTVTGIFSAQMERSAASSAGMNRPLPSRHSASASVCKRPWRALSTDWHRVRLPVRE